MRQIFFVLILNFFFSAISSQERDWKISIPASWTPGFHSWIQEWQAFLNVSEISHLQIIWNSEGIALYFLHSGNAKIPSSDLPLKSGSGGTYLGVPKNSVFPLDLKISSILTLQTPHALLLEVKNLSLGIGLQLTGQTEKERLQFVEEYLRPWCFHLESSSEKTDLSVHPELLTEYMKQFFIRIESWELIRYQQKPSFSLLDRLYQAGSTNPLLYYFFSKEEPTKYDFWLEEGRKKSPEPDIFCRRFGDYALAEGKYHWSLQSLHQINQVDEDLLAKKGYVLILLEREEEAKILFLEALRRNPHHEWSLFNLGRIAFRKGQYSQALAYFQQAQNILEKPEIARYLGSCYFQMKEWEKAIQIFRKLWKNGNVDPLLVSELATAYLKLKKRESAKELLQQVQSQLGTHPLILLVWSDLYLEEQNPQKALEFAEAVFKKYPENLRALFLRGKILLILGEFQEALPILQKVYQQKPEELEIQEELGHLYLAQGEVLKALEWLKRGCCQDLAYGRCLHYADQKEEATTFFQKNGVQEGNISEETAVAYVRFLLETNLQESLFQTQRFLKQWPQSVELLFYSGQAELLRENYGSARKYFQQCLQLFPEYEYFYFWNYLSESFLQQPTSFSKKTFQTPWLNQLKLLLLEHPEKQPETEDQWLEFYFYMGFYKIAIGKRALGEQLLKKCLETKKLDHIEFRFAKAYLQR
ncbi:MAG: tetratricopeptide repeat protein [Planctomycetota bacterium]